jgi:tRNA-specific 2-thiouridylase
MSTQQDRVIAAMSGGVDSSVTAALLQEQGHDVVGLFMRNGVTHKDADTRHQGCCSVEDSMDARRAASELDIPFYAINFKEDFGELIDHFVDEYNKGRTPNPCVRCNRTLKFGELMEYADEIGASKVATGHYVRLDQKDGRYRLRRGKDDYKDQSYVLFNLTQEQLSRSLFPLGELEKERVREIADDMDLGVADKPDSTEICFVPGQDYSEVLEDKTPEELEEGPIYNTDGEQLGTHPGHQHFTIGQRRGLGIAVGEPRYVVEIDPDENAVIVGPRDETFDDTCVAKELNWVSMPEPEPDEPIEADVQIRYNSDAEPAICRRTGADELHIEFRDPQHAISPGQAAVIYQGDTVLGGGWVDRIRNDH